MSAAPDPSVVYTEAEIKALLDAIDPGDAILTIEATLDGVPVSGEWWVPSSSPFAAKASTVRARKVRYSRVSSVIGIAVIRP